MANVLGELFGNIANAIRSKSGGTEAIKPADFAASILALSATGGTTTSGINKVTYGSYYGGTDGPATIEHGLGVTPDFVFVYAYGLTNLSTAGLVNAFGFSDAVLENVETSFVSGTVDNFEKRNVFYKTTANAGNEVSAFTDSKGIENSTAVGAIANANATSFTVGSTVLKHYDKLYYWFAVSIKS